MRTIEKIFDWIFKICEEFIPTISFAVMFVFFIIQIFTRYILNRPLFLADEIITTSYMWIVFMGAAYVMRRHNHINFTLVYDKQKPIGQAIFRLIGEVVMLVGILSALPDCFDFLDFLKFDKLPVLQWPVAIIYYPMVVSSILICLHLAIDFYKDISALGKEIKSV